MAKKNKPLILRIRKRTAPAGYRHRDEKKQANKRACRGRYNGD